jgi:hypothetical protein
MGTEGQGQLAASPVGLAMFMFADAILFMSKSHRDHDTVDQQERARH